MMKVSVIIPVYQISAYIERCICSVIAQSYTDIECIVVDDATRDDSILKCEQLISAYQGPIQFSILHHKENRGLSAARNTGTEAASGEYIYYLDGDDEITPDCIEKLIVPVLKDKSIEMVMGGVARLYDGKTKFSIYLEKEINGHNAVRDYFFSKSGFYVGAWNKLINRKFLINNQLNFEEGLLWEDQLWTFSVVKYLNHLYRISDITYLYYSRCNSISTGTKQDIAAIYWKKIYSKIGRNFTPGDSGREAQHYVKGLCVRYVKYQWGHDFCEIADNYMKALKEADFHPERFLLKTTIALSEYTIGRVVLRQIANGLKLLLQKNC